MDVLVLSGGGINATAQLGALKKLKEKNRLKNVDKIVACSAGTLVALAWLYSNQDAYECAAMLYDIKPPQINIANMLTKRSLFTFDTYTDKIRTLFGDMTMKQLPHVFGVSLWFSAVCLETRCVKYFGPDSDNKVLDVVSASCAIPFIFPAVSIDGGTWIDAGFRENCPMGFAKTLGTPIGINITRPPSSKIVSLYDYVMAVFYACQNKPLSNDNVINICCPRWSNGFYTSLEDLWVRFNAGYSVEQYSVEQ